VTRIWKISSTKKIKLTTKNSSRKRSKMTKTTKKKTNRLKKSYKVPPVV